MTEPAPHPPSPASPPLIPYAAGGFEAPYASPEHRSRWIARVAWAVIGVDVLLALPTAHHFLLWHAYTHEYDYGAWDLPVLGEWTVSDLVAWGLWGLGRVLNITLMVLWLMWVYRTYRNLRVLGATGLRYSPGWAVGYYFIPILNLFRPVQVMRETWKASDPAHAGGTAWQASAAPALLVWWWVFFVVGEIAWRSSDNLAQIYDQDATVQMTLDVVDLGLIAWDVVMTLMMIRIARKLTERQERRADALGIARGASAISIPLAALPPRSAAV